MKIYVGIKKWLIWATIAIVLAILIGIPLGRWACKADPVPVPVVHCNDGAVILVPGQVINCNPTETVELSQINNQVYMICHCDKK